MDDKEITNELHHEEMRKKLSALKDVLDTQLTTKLSEDVVNLSGDEAQKTVISRAFFKNHPLLFWTNSLLLLTLSPSMS